MDKTRQQDLRALWQRYFDGELFPETCEDWIESRIGERSWASLANNGDTCAVPALLGAPHDSVPFNTVEDRLGMAFWSAVSAQNRGGARYIFEALGALAQERGVAR